MVGKAIGSSLNKMKEMLGKVKEEERRMAELRRGFKATTRREQTGVGMVYLIGLIMLSVLREGGQGTGRGLPRRGWSGRLWLWPVGRKVSLLFVEPGKGGFAQCCQCNMGR